MLTLSFSVCVKYHSHRTISNHKLPGAAVCFWHGTKFGTRQHKLRARRKHACDCMRVCLWLLHVLCARVAPSVRETSVPHRTRLHCDITASKSNNGHISPSSSFLSLSLSVLSILAPSNRVWTSTVKQTAAHTVGERKRLQKKKEKKPLAAQRKKEEQLQAGLAIALRREDLALFISETTNTKNIFDVPERQQDYICMELTVE